MGERLASQVRQQLGSEQNGGGLGLVCVHDIGGFVTVLRRDNWVRFVWGAQSSLVEIACPPTCRAEGVSRSENDFPVLPETSFAAFRSNGADMTA